MSVLLLGVPQIAGTVADNFNYQTIDPDGSFAWITIHHIVQALIFLLIIIVISSRFKTLEFGFGWGNKEAGKRYVFLFSLIFGIGSIVSHLIVVLTSSFQQFAYPLTTTNIVGQMGFQLLLSGPSEELIFRAFAITMLGLVIKTRIFNGRVSVANIIAAIIFGLAHADFSLLLFEVNHNLYQVIMAVILGLIYGDCYEKTGSMLYPMMMHSISNIIMVGLTIVITYVIY